MRENKAGIYYKIFLHFLFLSYFSGDRGKFYFSIFKNKKKGFLQVLSIFQLIQSWRHQSCLTDSRGKHRWPHLHIRLPSHGCQVTCGQMSSKPLQWVPCNHCPGAQFSICCAFIRQTAQILCPAAWHSLKSTESSASLPVLLALHIPGNNTDAEN